MKRIGLIITALLFLAGCATVLPPHPTSCKYHQKEVSFYSIDIPDTERTYYCTDAQGMSNLEDNWNNMGQCMTDAELWILQVEQASE